MDFWLMVNIAGGILLAATVAGAVGFGAVIALAFYRAGLDKEPSLRHVD